MVFNFPNLIRWRNEGFVMEVLITRIGVEGG